MNHTVLIIDDDQDLADALSELLAYEGYETTVATSGMAGLRQIQSATPDLVLCDWQMPNLNGAELLRELRLSENTAHVPFIIMTGHTITDIDFEPTAVLIKPIFIFTLIDTIKQAIKGIRA